MAKKNNTPMSLEDLPQYLKSLKENGEIGDCGVVDMGMVVGPKKSYSKWLAFAALMLFGIGGVIAYDSMSVKQHTIVLDIQDASDPNQMISQIIADSGGQILTVKHNNDSTYEVEINTRKNKRSFLEWLRKNKNVKKAN